MFEITAQHMDLNGMGLNITIGGRDKEHKKLAVDVASALSKSGDFCNVRLVGKYEVDVKFN